MATANVIVLSYVRDKNELRSPARISTYLADIAARGYYVAAASEGFDDRWAQAVAQGNISAGVSTALRGEIDAFSAGASEDLSCSAFAVSGAFHFEIALYYPDGFIYLSASDRYFKDGEQGLKTYDEWLEIIALTYRVWHPVYGYQGSYTGNAPSVTREEALAGRAPWLYDINVFGPEYVAALGRERLLSAPAWKVIPMSDGGIILAPTAYAHPDTRYDRHAIADSLGLPTE